MKDSIQGYYLITEKDIYIVDSFIGKGSVGSVYLIYKLVDRKKSEEKYVIKL